MSEGGGRLNITEGNAYSAGQSSTYENGRETVRDGVPSCISQASFSLQDLRFEESKYAGGVSP